MKSMDVFRYKKVPTLTFQVMLVVRHNNNFVARGTLSDGTRTTIPTAALLADWELVKEGQ